MAILQILAANLAEIDLLVFFTGDEAKSFDRAQMTLEEVAPSNTTIPMEPLIQSILERGYSWGVSDGN